MVVCLLLSHPHPISPLLRQALTRGSAPGCAACPCETSCRGRGCVYAAGYQNPLCGPKPRSWRDRTDPQTRTWGQHAWRARPTRRGGWAAGGAGGGLSPPRGGAQSPAPARRPSPAGKVGLREAGVAGATPSRRATPRLPGSRAPGLRCRKGRAVTVSWIGNIAPSPGPAPSRLRPGLCPRPAPRGGGSLAPRF